MDSLTAGAPAPRDRRHDGRLTPPAGSNGHRQLRAGVLRVETTDVDEGMRIAERVLAVAAKQWRFRRSTPTSGRAIVLEYECRLRRTYTPEVVRTQLLYQGVPFIRAAEWEESVGVALLFSLIVDRADVFKAKRPSGLNSRTQYPPSTKPDQLNKDIERTDTLV